MSLFNDQLTQLISDFREPPPLMAKIRLTDRKKQLLMFPKETLDNQITEYPMMIDISLLLCNKTKCQGMGSVKWAVFFSSSQ